MTLNNISWSFSKEFYTDIDKCNNDVIQYQKRIYKTDKKWKPNEIVLGFPEVQIQYEAYIRKPTDLLENEILFGEGYDFEEGDMFEVEIIAKFKADNGQHFTALEFLMKTHNQQANKELGDHVFFEGIDEEEPEIIDNLPTYYIACGS